MATEPTVFVVDDDLDTRESIAMLLRSKKVHVECFESAESFFENYHGQSLACLLIDVRMKGMSGLEAQQHIQEHGFFLPTIVISGHGDVPIAVKSMEFGAITFLEKPCHHDKLWEAIEKGMKIAEEHCKTLSQTTDIRQRFATLTADERKVLVEVMAGTPNKKIATDLDMGLRTVELRRANIMKKTGAASLPELVRLALEINFPQDAPMSSLSTKEV
jgi:two-component system, LuxR family, response regulator FixJ